MEEALPSPVFKSLDELRQPDSLKGADLLVLPYGSAFPVEAWTEIEKHLTSGGNLPDYWSSPGGVALIRSAAGAHRIGCGREAKQAKEGSGRIGV